MVRSLIALLLAGGLCSPIIPPAPAFADGGKLLKALGEARGGDTIRLPAGDYGDVVLSNLDFSEPVQIRSADPERAARFRSLRIDNVRGLKIDGITVAHPGNGAAASKIVSIENSRQVALLNSEVHGLEDKDYFGHYGIHADGNTDIRISGNYVHDVKNGFVIYPNQGIEISGNYVDYIGSDGFKFIGITDFLIENNTQGGHVYPLAGAGWHLDFMQFQGAGSSDGIVRGNVFLAKTDAAVQGIFMKGAAFNDILIEQNIIATGMFNGIVVNGDPGTSGMNVRDNTLINIPDIVHKATIVRVGEGSVVSVTGNLMGHEKGQLIDGNLLLQVKHRGQPYHYNTVFAKGLPRLGMVIGDLIPVKGGPAEGFGAYARLRELLSP
ncbi:right-handed parallel beta-helix repeat-containing protein [Ruegeria sp. Ofav3-42]|uniref:right-handed parallel beta-helix repeat-containing protein n=1 Tax=Ruegeria sp. Ofav3-42 TaxID=2917759 RepID=UPI001EF45563|nr:right-handed parallel beta-helix repeat-containing protein [Ruegeria sp. Ofav3-42]MCG7522416.1 right-handed parallel beta-helix repeat-containing protein [Ruegeria sp. Ofav3-42]